MLKVNTQLLSRTKSQISSSILFQTTVHCTSAKAAAERWPCTPRRILGLQALQPLVQPWSSSPVLPFVQQLPPALRGQGRRNSHVQKRLWGWEMCAERPGPKEQSETVIGHHLRS